MALASLGNVFKVFRGDELSAEESNELAREVLLLTLARATRADTRVVPIEVGTVQAAIKRAIGEELSVAEIRVAASSELFEPMSLESALARLGEKLTPANRAYLAQSLADVIKSDARISGFELDYFDSVTKALGIRESELAGLLAD
jgi:uncharacterized tellurite resistance protein B-like protein